MRSRLPVLAAVVAGFALAASAAGATQPHERNGFFIGFGLGGGNASFELGDAGSGVSDSEAGGVGNFRLGGALTPQLLLGFESTAWVYSEDTELGDATWTLSVAAFAATWYPVVDEGFYLRGGLGFASSRWDLDTDTVDLSYDENGFGLLGAAGYEWRLTRKFAMGPQVELVWLSIGEEVVDSAVVVDGSLQFDWYW